MTAIVPAWTGSLTTRSASAETRAGHAQGHHRDAQLAQLAHGLGDLTTHQRTGQHEDVGARQVGHGAHGGGDLVLAHEGHGVDRDALATQVVAVALGDRAKRHLGHLGTAADDDDALAEDLAQRRPRAGRVHAGHGFGDLGRLDRAEVAQLDVEDARDLVLLALLGGRERVDGDHVRAGLAQAHQDLGRGRRRRWCAARWRSARCHRWGSRGRGYRSRGCRRGCSWRAPTMA